MEKHRLWLPEENPRQLAGERGERSQCRQKVTVCGSESNVPVTYTDPGGSCRLSGCSDTSCKNPYNH